MFTTSNILANAKMDECFCVQANEECIIINSGYNAESEFGKFMIELYKDKTLTECQLILCKINYGLLAGIYYPILLYNVYILNNWCLLELIDSNYKNHLCQYQQLCNYILNNALKLSYMIYDFRKRKNISIHIE